MEQDIICHLLDLDPQIIQWCGHGLDGWPQIGSADWLQPNALPDLPCAQQQRVMNDRMDHLRARPCPPRKLRHHCLGHLDAPVQPCPRRIVLESLKRCQRGLP